MKVDIFNRCDKKFIVLLRNFLNNSTHKFILSNKQFSGRGGILPGLCGLVVKREMQFYPKGIE